MNKGLSEQVRQLAIREYVEPARRNGNSIVIAIGDIQQKLLRRGFPANHTNQICRSLESERYFTEPLGLVLETPRGQPARVGTILRYRVDTKATVDENLRFAPERTNELSQAGRVGDFSGETSEQWATRMTEPIRGILKDELAAYGGGEAFIRWIRSDDEQVG